MTRYLIVFLATLLAPVFLFSQKVGYQVKVKIDGYQGQQAYLGYYYGDKQYIKDTTYIQPNGWFYFEGNENLEGGMYLIVLPPENQFIQVLIDENSQWVSLETKFADMAGNMKVSGSTDNKLFYDYLNFLTAKRPKAEELRRQLEAAGDDEKKKTKIEDKIKTLDTEVEDYQKRLIAGNPGTMTAAVVRVNLPLEGMPEFSGEKKDFESFYWTRSHWFDNIDLADQRMVRTPFLFPKIESYVSKMTVPQPDSINAAIDKVLEMLRPAEETFKYYLIHFLNEYAKSNYVGMDAVYVHIAQTYYKTGQAPWTEEEQLKKIIDNADKLEPLLLGKIAPDIEMETQDGHKMKLSQFKSPLTVLFFWDPDCGHCKKSMPEMVQFAKDYKDKGVAVFAICTKLATRDDSGNITMKEVNECWETIKERNMDVFFNTVDPYHRSRYKTVYDIRSTPQIYVLDENKEILSKKIGAEQLHDVMDHILKAKAEKAENGG